MSTATSSDLLNREQAAEYLGVRPQTLSSWACLGRYELPFIKVGRLIRYRKGDLDAWLETRRVGGNALEVR
jgi:excisionase family DNA binding protein